MHLNNDDPCSEKFAQLWKNANKWSKQNKRISIMIGGAGLAYQNLFKHYKLYWDMLVNFLSTHTFITGIVLDVEEIVPVQSM